MIVMRLVLHSICAFQNFELSCSYPKKIIGSTIETEWLEDRPNFRYKKLIVVMGANATGKTTLGKVLMGIFNFIARKGTALITEMICDGENDAAFTIDFVPSRIEPTLYRVSTHISPSPDGSYTAENFSITVTSIPIRKNDTYETCKARLDTIPGTQAPLATAFDTVPSFGWNFTFPELDGPQKALKKPQDVDFLETLEKVLCTLDPAIEAVNSLPDVGDAYVVHLNGRSVVLKDGKILDEDILSSGTKTGFGIAMILTSIITHENGFYYCDEKFSYVHSEVEQMILSKMIEKLGSYEQLFFTTHNRDILELALPNHSFLFLKKDAGEIVPLYADSILKRNTDSLRNAVENDLFAISPDIGRISDL